MIQTLFTIWIICWVITRFEPLQMVLELLPNKLLWNLFKLLITCLKCLTFWVTLIWTEDIFSASLIAFISFWYDKVIGPEERRVKL
jgi:hypothetical protein